MNKCISSRYIDVLGLCIVHNMIQAYPSIISVSAQFSFSFIILFMKLHNNFLCSHIAQLVEAGRGHLNIK